MGNSRVCGPRVFSVCGSICFLPARLNWSEPNRTSLFRSELILEVSLQNSGSEIALGRSRPGQTKESAWPFVTEHCNFALSACPSPSSAVIISTFVCNYCYSSSFNGSPTSRTVCRRVKCPTNVEDVVRLWTLSGVFGQYLNCSLPNSVDIGHSFSIRRKVASIQDIPTTIAS